MDMKRVYSILVTKIQIRADFHLKINRYFCNYEGVINRHRHITRYSGYQLWLQSVPVNKSKK